MDHWYVILNPQAGRARAAKQRSDLIAALAQAEIPFVLEETYGADSATILTQTALEQGYTRIVAAGGDGTFHEVVNGIMRHNGSDRAGTTLALIPMGTGNDFIKSLDGFRAYDLTGSAQRIATGKTRTIDLMQMTTGVASQQRTRYVLNDVGIGVYSQVAAETFKITHLKGWKVYALALIRALLVYRPIPLSIHYEGNGKKATIEQYVLLACTSNGRWQGAGFQLTPQAILDDGFLDLCVIDAVGWFEIIRHLPRVRKGTHIHIPQVMMRQVERVVLSSPEPLLVSCDGEIAAASTHHIEIAVVPRALTMIG